jgi:hypothetical protein
LELRPWGEGDAIPVNVRNGWRNSPNGCSMRESGFFHNVTIATRREINFWSDNGKIYYWGHPDFSGTCYLDDVECDPGEVFVHAACTRFGDWNGDGRIIGLEFQALQNAIQYGPYNGLYDGDCSGTLDNDDLNKFLANYGNALNGSFLMSAPDPGDGGLPAGEGAAAEGAGDDGTGVDDVVDLAEVAAALVSSLAPEDLSAFIAPRRAPPPPRHQTRRFRPS